MTAKQKQLLTTVALRREMRRKRILESVAGAEAAALPPTVRTAIGGPRKGCIMVDPVCGELLDPATAIAQAIERELVIYFCSTHCMAEYIRNINRYNRLIRLETDSHGT